jgi:tetratricopeptide (TPR) repeat protein
MNEKEVTTETNIDQDPPKKEKKKFFERRSGWIITGALLVVVIFLLGSVSGAARGINDRVSLAEAQALPRIQSQLAGARQDIEEGRYEVALGRLDWILDEMAEFLTEAELAEIGELYSQTLVLISSRSTPTPQPSPTPTVPAFTPTPDLRGAEELYNTATQFMAQGAWEDAIQALAALREKDLTYRTVQVDGLLYIALRNRGIDKILAQGSLEPGLYDLALAERFAPLDSRAEGLRTWTRFYLTGASFWNVDWSQVVFYFEQVYPHLPNLRDGTFMTATERYRLGAIEYAADLVAAGEYCLALEYYQKALGISENADVRSLAQQASEACAAGASPPAPGPGESPTPVPTDGVQPTPAPTDVPTEEPTPEPTEEGGEGG